MADRTSGGPFLQREWVFACFPGAMSNEATAEGADVMVAKAISPLEERQVNAIALGAAEADPPETVNSARAGARAALSRARARLSRRLLAEIWTESANLDVAIWGPAVSDVEADRYLRDAAERGVIYLDPAPAAEQSGRLRRLVRRLAG